MHSLGCVLDDLERERCDHLLHRWEIGTGGQEDRPPEGLPCSPPVHERLQGILSLIIKMPHRCWGLGWYERSL